MEWREWEVGFQIPQTQGKTKQIQVHVPMQNWFVSLADACRLNHRELKEMEPILNIQMPLLGFFAAEYKNGVKTRQQKPSGHFFIPPMSWLAGAFFKSANYPQLSPCFFFSSFFFKVEHVTLFHKKIVVDIIFWSFPVFRLYLKFI